MGFLVVGAAVAVGSSMYCLHNSDQNVPSCADITVSPPPPPLDLHHLVADVYPRGTAEAGTAAGEEVPRAQVLAGEIGELRDGHPVHVRVEGAVGGILNEVEILVLGQVTIGVGVGGVEGGDTRFDIDRGSSSSSSSSSGGGRGGRGRGRGGGVVSLERPSSGGLGGRRSQRVRPTTRHRREEQKSDHRLPADNPADDRSTFPSLSSVALTHYLADCIEHDVSRFGGEITRSEDVTIQSDERASKDILIHDLDRTRLGLSPRHQI